jgi:uncharacterized membrane protein
MPSRFLTRHLKLILASNLISSILLILSLFSEQKIAISLVLVTCIFNLLISFNLPLSNIQDVKLSHLHNYYSQRLVHEQSPASHPKWRAVR